MREYLNKISDLIPQLEKSSTFEEVMKNITHFSFSNLGNRENAKKGENLKKGELDQYACGSFILINKDKQILIGPQNYAKEQEYMILDTNIGHPGWVIENKKRLILTNTDEHKSFVKILKTFRAGSAIYAPILTSGKFIGQIICASQARNVMEEIDLSCLNVLANLASVYWIKKNGESEIGAIYQKVTK